jgi:hypothetical protein
MADRIRGELQEMPLAGTHADFFKECHATAYAFAAPPSGPDEGLALRAGKSMHRVGLAVRRAAEALSLISAVEAA